MTMHPCHHYGRARHLHTYLDILQKEGADINKCYMSHMEFWHKDIDYQKSLLDRGITLSYDQFELIQKDWSCWSVGSAQQYQGSERCGMGEPRFRWSSGGAHLPSASWAIAQILANTSRRKSPACSALATNA